MTDVRLTSEQEAVVGHPVGRHARVISAPGCGKTTTLAHRVLHLLDIGVHKSSIVVLMFNVRTRKDFQRKLEEAGLSRRNQPRVSTFHSLALAISNWYGAQAGWPRKTIWQEEQVTYWIREAIEQLVESGDLSREDAEKLDIEEVKRACDLWKCHMIRVGDAGHRNDKGYELVYGGFERLRRSRNALTFADFTPRAVWLLANRDTVRQRWATYDHVLVDEAQDLDYAQAQMITLLAGARADVMLCGDPNQEVYGFRGSRQEYLLSEFASLFPDKPQNTYKLSRSFRSGPIICACADNLITHNAGRVDNVLVANCASRYGEVWVYKMADANRELARKMISLVKDEGVAPAQIRVLGRTYSQLAGIESELLMRRVPYRVVGRAPFFRRRECRALLDYIRAAMTLDEAISEQSIERLLGIANIPPRALPCQALGQALRLARHQKATIRQALMSLEEHPELSTQPSQQSLGDLVALLDALKDRMGNTSASALLSWLINETGYLEALEGVHSVSLKHTVTSFVEYAGDLRLGPLEFIKHITELNTGRGVPQDQQIVLSTIHKQKGAEFDHVFLPDSTEGFLPCLHEEDNPIYDKSGTVDVPSCSSSVASERRLFYTGITRARTAVYIGTSEPVVDGATSRPPSRFIDELDLEATVRTMGTLQRVASGEDGAKADLVTAVQQCSDSRRVIRTLISEYLKDIGDDTLISEVSKAAASTPETPSDHTPTTPGVVKPEPAQVLHRVWADVAF
jgi:DNA helicase-2/ATP-dependent DNA helicase PcrA